MKPATLGTSLPVLMRSAFLGTLAVAAMASVGWPALAQTTAPRIGASNYQPPYPDTAQVNGEHGDVVLDVNVGANGKVRRIRINTSSGFADLDNAAIEGVLGWHFVPAMEGGDATSGWTTVKIHYELPQAQPAAASGQTTH